MRDLKLWDKINPFVSFRRMLPSWPRPLNSTTSGPDETIARTIYLTALGRPGASP